MQHQGNREYHGSHEKNENYKVRRKNCIRLNRTCPASKSNMEAHINSSYSTRTIMDATRGTQPIEIH